jgi:hypothetical protein
LLPPINVLPQNTSFRQTTINSHRPKHPSTNFLVFVTNKVKTGGYRHTSAVDLGTVRAMKILKILKKNKSLTLLSNRFFTSQELRYKVQRFARKSRLGATVPRFYTFILDSIKEMYSPYSPVSGAFTSLPENAFVTPSYFLISSPTKFISSPQWVYLRESKLNAHKFASLGASNLKLKAFKTTERNETLKTSKLLKKLSLLFFRLNLNFLLDHRGTGKQLKSLKKSSEF